MDEQLDNCNIVRITKGTVVLVHFQIELQGIQTQNVSHLVFSKMKREY